MAEKSSLLKSTAAALKKAFWAYQESDAEQQNHVAASQLFSDNNHYYAESYEKQGDAEVADFDMVKLREGLPHDRESRIAILDALSQDPILANCIGIHLTHALSPKSRTGEIFTIEHTEGSSDKIVDEIIRDLQPMLNANLMQWCRPMAEFGVSYVRPYCAQGKGIQHIEFGFHTHAKHIREFERAGQLAGYTNMYLTDKRTSDFEKLVEPWKLVPFKIPHYKVDLANEPIYQNQHRYSMHDDDFFERSVVETQNYGTSILEDAYEPWLDLAEGLLSLRASRRLAGKIDRVIGAPVGNKDVTSAAAMINLISRVMKAKSDLLAEDQKKRQYLGTVHNTVIPTTEAGQLNFDTQVYEVNIQHIEDINFAFKRMCSATGLDPALLGWGDQMAGGLGTDAWLRTSINSTIRANWIRKGAEEGIHRLIDIHLAYKYGKTFAGERPYRIAFNSMNTAIEQEEIEAQQMRVGKATELVGLLDAISMGSLNGKTKIQHHVLTQVLQMSEDDAKVIIDELATAAADQAEMMTEGLRNTADLKQQMKQNLLEILEELEQENNHGS